MSDCYRGVSVISVSILQHVLVCACCLSLPSRRAHFAARACTEIIWLCRVEREALQLHVRGEDATERAVVACLHVRVCVWRSGLQQAPSATCDLFRVRRSCWVAYVQERRHVDVPSLGFYNINGRAYLLGEPCLAGLPCGPSLHGRYRRSS